MPNEDSKPGPSGSNFVFRDVEEALETFNGESSRVVSTWLKNFEDIAVVCGWSDVQMYLYARRLLKGAARLSVESATGIYSWNKLKQHLEKEFSEKETSINIHRALEKRKKQPGESYLEYLYTMKQIASRGDVDEESLIIYIVSGISDEVVNKAVLYEARNLDELKQKFKVYQTMKSQKNLRVSKPNFEREKGRENNQNKDRCANCGAKSHPSSSCPHRAKWARCFNCNEFGHMSPNCPQPKRGTTRTDSQNVNIITSPDMHINVLLEGREYSSLLDTGSDVSLIRQSVHAKVSTSRDMTGPSTPLLGFGKHLKMTLGSCVLTLTIANENFVVRCHVVPDAWISTDILIGKDLLKEAKLTIEGGKITISKRCKSKANEGKSIVFEEMDVVQLVKDSNLGVTDDIANAALREEVDSLISNYVPVKPEKSCIEMIICLENEMPVYQKPRRLACNEREVVQNQVQQWLEEGVIRASSSSFASPIVLAKKKDGSARLCVDYRKLNEKVIKDRYPLPIIEDILESLHDARVFTTLDLRNGFFHVDIKEECRKYTSFVTPDGQYEFLKAPFGLCNSPAVFQRFINTIFQPLIRKGVLFIYMDDIIIPSDTEKQNLESLRETLHIAQENGLIVKWAKCKFLRRSITFLGHVVEAGSIKPSEEKIGAVKHFPVPKTVKQLQGFLGLTGFFRKFVPQYSITAAPLTNLLKKNAVFELGPKELDAFNLLKEGDYVTIPY